MPSHSLEALIPRFDEALDALERRDLDAFIAIVRDLTDPGCEFRSGIGSAVGGGVYKGPEGISEWFGDLLGIADEVHWRERRYKTFGERVLLYLAQFEFIGSASQVPLAGEVAVVYEFEDGLCVRIDSFVSHDEARKFAEGRVA